MQEETQTDVLLLMIYILHYLKDPKLWELWCISLILGILQDLYRETPKSERNPEV